MPKTPTESRVSIRIEGTRITPARFKEGVDALMGIVREVTKSLCGSASAMDWSVYTDKGSAVLGVMAIPAKPEFESDAPKITTTVEKGIRTVNGPRACRPKHFSDAALEGARVLADLARAHGEGISRVIVQATGRPVAFKARAAANIAEIIGETVVEQGTVEGRLVSLSRIGSLKGRIYDDLTKAPVACFFAASLMSALKKAWYERVAASGKVHYNSAGTPTRIYVSEMKVFRDPTELPQWEDLRGILAE